MMSRSVPAVLLLFALASCGELPVPTAAPAPESGPANARSADPGTVREQGRYQVAMLDNCGFPATWAATGGCAIAGTVSNPAFFAMVNATGSHPDWRNDPTSLDVKWNAKLLVTNVGGRGHTFTRVPAFGGGYIPFLNVLPDTKTIAQGCEVRKPEEIVAPGASIEVRTDHGAHVGDHDELYQCCLHPWMRTTVHVRHDAPR